MKVLYATDGSMAADNAKHTLMKLFRRDGLDVSVVSVTHAWSLDPGHLVIELDPIAERRGDTHELVAYVTKELDAAGFDATSTVLEGQPGHEIVKLAREGFDLVVVGGGSHSWLDNRLLGSVSTYVLHEAPCSVLVVHDAPSNDAPSRVIVGVDGSNTSDETVGMLTRILDPTLVEIEVVSVVSRAQVPVPAPILMVPMAYPSEEAIEQADSEMTARAEGFVDRAAGVLRDAGFSTKKRIERGGAATVLLEEARVGKADLVAVGSRGLGPIRRVFLGSVSDQIARHAPAALVGRFWINTKHAEELPLT